MARYNFGGSLTDFAILAPSGQSNVVKSQPNIANGTFWSALSGGVQYTDMLIGGAASTVVKTDAEGFLVRFQGPHGVDDGWVDLGGGSRYYVVASSIGSMLDGKSTLPAAGSASVALVGSRKTGNLRTGANSVEVASNSVHNAFPALAVCTDGTLVTAYRSGSAHDASVGVIKVRRYSANGVALAAAATAISDALDCRDPMLTTMPDGTLVLQFFKHNGTNAIGVYISKSADNGATWGTPIGVGFTWNTAIASSGRVVVAANGDWIIPAYGRDASTYYRIRLMRSTNQGESWSGEVTVADGQAESRNYMEPVMGLLPDGSTLMCLIRVADAAGTNPEIYRTTSTDNGLTWSAEASILTTAGGRPAWISLSSGGVLLCYRSTTAPSPMQYRTSWDNGLTWTSALQLGATPASQGAYAQPVEVAQGLVGVVYSVETSSTSSDVRLGYLADGFGFTPMGDAMNDADPIFKSAAEGAVAGSAPTLTQYFGWPMWSMSASASDQLGFTFRLPASWKTFDISYVWVNMAAGSGNVVFRHDYNVINTGSALPSTAGTSQTVAANGDGILTETTAVSGVSRSGEWLRVKPTRLGADAADTLANTIGILGVKITRAS